MIASAAMARIPENFPSEARSASSTRRRARNRVSTMNCRASTSASRTLTTSNEVDRSRLHEKAELERKLHVVRSVRQAELFLNPLLVRIHRLRADEQTLPNLRRGVPLRNETPDVSLALSELVEPLTLRFGGIFFGQVPGENSAGARMDVHIAVRHGTHRVHQVPVGGALHEITRCTSL